MGEVPKHIAIILDGNRRFAKRLMMKPWKGHEWGAQKVEALLEWCYDLKIEELTLFAFSMQNFNRPQEEYNFLMTLFSKEWDRLMTEKRAELDKHGIRITFIGRLWLFPEPLQQRMQKLMDMTKNNTMHKINIAMAYGGREEVIDAVKKVAEAVKIGTLNVQDINEQTFGHQLYLESEPDLIIRTGGDRRTSNFLIWQSNYSEWLFLEKTWPEFEKEDLITAVNDFATRERRFGK